MSISYRTFFAHLPGKQNPNAGGSSLNELCCKVWVSQLLSQLLNNSERKSVDVKDYFEHTTEIDSTRALDVSTPFPDETRSALTDVLEGGVGSDVRRIVRQRGKIKIIETNVDAAFQAFPETNEITYTRDLNAFLKGSGLFVPTDLGALLSHEIGHLAVYPYFNTNSYRIRKMEEIYVTRIFENQYRSDHGLLLRCTYFVISDVCGN